MASIHRKAVFLKPDDNIVVERDVVASDGDTLQSKVIYNAHHNLSIEAQRQRLPIREYRDQILYCLENYQILILIGETGSGKSTQLPQYIYEWGWHVKGIIGVTQPKRISAVTLAERVAFERGELLGDTVGVSVRFNSNISKNTCIKYMTEEILLREMLSDPLLTKYSVIMIDEAHERNILTDTLLGLIKKIVKKRDSLKIIISSATLDAEYFQNFFSSKAKNLSKPKSVILTVQGRMHPVKIFYLDQPCPDYLKETVATIWKIHNSEPLGDILAFLTGQDEVLTVYDLLQEYIHSEKREDIEALTMYGALSFTDQLKVFSRSAKNVRKAIIATNIAETSITIPRIVYVIDCGFVKLKCFHSKYSLESLSIVPVSKAAAEQRAGRAGRVMPGKVYRLYTQEYFNTLLDQTPPELCRSELSMMVLKLKALGIDNILRFDFPSPPPAKNLLATLETLFALSVINDVGRLEKPVGYLIAELPVDPMMGKMLYVSGQMGCSEEIITIIAMLQVQNVYSKPTSKGNQSKAVVAKRNFEVAEGDLITLLNVYAAFIESERPKEFCGRYFLIYRNLKRAHEIRMQLAKTCSTSGIPLHSCRDNVEMICKCITAGFFRNAVYLHHSGVYKTIRGNLDLYINPTSVLYSSHLPRFLIYCELLQTTKLFMKELTVIKEDWLIELAPHYYKKHTVAE